MLARGLTRDGAWPSVCAQKESKCWVYVCVLGVWGFVYEKCVEQAIIDKNHKVYGYVCVCEAESQKVCVRV